MFRFSLNVLLVVICCVETGSDSGPGLLYTVCRVVVLYMHKQY